MNLLTINELTELATESHSTCVSIYTPMERLGAETLQNPIRFKNLMREAESQLIEAGMTEQEARNLLQPAQELDSYDFWQHQNDGLAILISPNQVRYYCLPIAFPELVVVSDRFHIKPLLQLFSGDGQFYLLALSQNQIRLFQGTRYSVSEIELTDMPTSLAEALKYDDPEKNLQFHTETSQVGASQGDRAAMFHGHGAGKEDHKTNLLRYFRKVNDGLQSYLEQQQAPLVLAGVDYLLPIYQEANTYAHLLPEGITGNPEELKPEELHEKVWHLVQPHFEQARETAISQYRELQGTGKTASEIEQVVSAAYYQRVDALLVLVGQQIWGSFDPEANTVHIHPEPEAGDEDLLDLAALHTMMNGGMVYTVEDTVPEESPVAAILRY